MSNSLDPAHALRFYQAWFGPTLFAKFISRRKKNIASKERIKLMTKFENNVCTILIVLIISWHCSFCRGGGPFSNAVKIYKMSIQTKLAVITHSALRASIRFITSVYDTMLFIFRSVQKEFSTIWADVSRIHPEVLPTWSFKHILDGFINVRRMLWPWPWRKIWK